MNLRIKKILLDSKLKNFEFAEKIGVDQSYISKMISGEKTPSKRVTEKICEKIKIDGRTINEDWLETGIGEPYLSLTRNQEIQKFVSEIMLEVDDSFKKRFIKALSSLDESDWQTIEKIANELEK